MTRAVRIFSLSLCFCVIEDNEKCVNSFANSTMISSTQLQFFSFFFLFHFFSFFRLQPLVHSSFCTLPTHDDTRDRIENNVLTFLPLFNSKNIASGEKVIRAILRTSITLHFTRITSDECLRQSLYFAISSTYNCIHICMYKTKTGEADKRCKKKEEENAHRV